jgi:hypothetical protein
MSETHCCPGYANSLHSFTTMVKKNRLRCSHRDAILARRTESSRTAVPILVLARGIPSEKGAKWAVNLLT